MGSSNGIDSLSGSDWEHIISPNRSGNFGNSSNIPLNDFDNPHYTVMLENQFSHLVHFQTDSLEHFRNPEDGAFGISPNGKRKIKMSLGGSLKNAEEERHKDPSEDTSEFPKEDEMNQKFDRKISAKSINRQTLNQAMENAVGSEENYVHVRAKRGQATNSHSLAERMRRERISERMKLLQELVPGCNKITGKAVMLDEIINYVQSLQQQVEFLSMKLATVNPELNADIEQILSKDVLCLRGNNPTVLGMGLSHPSMGFSHGNFHSVADAAIPFRYLPQNSWNNEFQSILQMELDSNPSANGLGPINGQTML